MSASFSFSPMPSGRGRTSITAEDRAVIDAIPWDQMDPTNHAQNAATIEVPHDKRNYRKSDDDGASNHAWRLRAEVADRLALDAKSDPKYLYEGGDGNRYQLGTAGARVSPDGKTLSVTIGWRRLS